MVFLRYESAYVCSSLYSEKTFWNKSGIWRVSRQYVSSYVFLNYPFGKRTCHNHHIWMVSRQNESSCESSGIVLSKTSWCRFHTWIRSFLQSSSCYQLFLDERFVQIFLGQDYFISKKVSAKSVCYLSRIWRHCTLAFLKIKSCKCWQFSFMFWVETGCDVNGFICYW